MANDRLSSLASLADEFSEDPVEVSPGFSDQDLAELKQQMAEELRQTSLSDVDYELEEGGWENEDSLAAAQRFFSSMALGWGDELGIAVAAAGASASTGENWSDVYKAMKKSYDEQQRQFEQRQGGAALAADVAGAIASPLTYVAAPFTAASKAGQAASFLGRAATEGAIYGAGEADLGERLEGAGSGAVGGVFGAGLAKGATGVGGLIANTVTKRRIAEDLIDADGDFLPITLAAKDPKGVEGVIHQFYRDVLGPAFGAKGIIREQEDVIIGKTEEAIKSQKEFTKNLDEGIKIAEKQIEGSFKAAAKEISEQAKEARKVKEKKAKEIIEPLKEKLKAFETGKAEEIVGKAAADVRAMTNSRRFNFRNEAFVSSMPAAATLKDMADILKIEDMGQRAQALDSLWNEKGYDMIKNKSFRFKSGELERNLEEALDKDPYFKVNIVDIPSVMKVFDLAVENTNFFRDKSGRVPGSLVSALRSRIGTLASGVVDPQQRKALYTLQSRIDDIIQGQLTQSQKEAFKREAGKWKTTVVLRNAIESASLKKRGQFDEEDWLKEVGKNNRWDSRYGTGPLTRQARTLEDNIASATKSTAKRASNLAKVKAMGIEKTIRDHRNELESALKKLKAREKSDLANLSKDPKLAEQIAQDRTKATKAQAELEILDKELKKLGSLRAQTSPGWFHSLAAIGFLAAVLSGGAVSGIGAAGLAVTAARGLSRPGAQLAVAGQTKRQEAIQQALQSEQARRQAQTLALASGAVGSRVGGMLSGQPSQ